MDQKEKADNKEGAIHQRNDGLLEKEVWLESDLADFLSINRYAGLRDLRNRGLPFIRLNSQKRIYLESSVYDWLKTQEINE